MADYNRNTYPYILCFSSTLSGVISYVFYRKFRSRNETVRQFRDILVWHPDDELKVHLNQQDNHHLDYAVVEGVVKELGRTLRSNHVDEKGVAIRSQIVEHRTKFENGFWVDMRRVIKDSIEVVPFAIVKESIGDSRYKVEVLKPTKAVQFESELETTYDRFEPSTTSFGHIGWLNRLSMEFTKGIQVTEKMLLTGTNIMGIGKVFLEQGKMKISAPDDSERSYILTRMRLQELITHYESQSTTYKVGAIITACVGGILLMYAIYRHKILQLEEHHQRLEFEEIRRSIDQQRLEFQNAQNAVSEVQIVEETEVRPQDRCVICLADARNVIALPCGHFAMCSYCAEALSLPKTCPVCRVGIDKFMPVFLP